MTRLMHISIGLMLSVLSTLAISAEVSEVVVLATGGTIAGSGKSSTAASYEAAKLPIDKLLNSVPEIHDLAKISGEQVAQIGSQAITTEIWLELARRVEHHLSRPAVAGVVITHGTDTMEETAYFLDLVIDSDKPIVLVGSMRPPTSLSSDGARNLFNAVALAANPDARRYGALIVMNDSILSARDATKSNTTAVNTFVSRGKGPVGHIELGNPTFYQPSARRNSHFNISAIESLPSVDIVYGYANASPIPVNALVANGSNGIVHAGVGNGNLFPAVETALAKARKRGVVIVRSTRVGSGHVLRNAEVDDDALDFIVADDLSPQKARILLMLALTKTSATKQIQELYYDL